MASGVDKDMIAGMRSSLEELRTRVRALQARLESSFEDNTQPAPPSSALSAAVAAAEANTSSLRQGKELRWFHNEVMTILFEELVARTLLPLRGSSYRHDYGDIQARAGALEAILKGYPAVSAVVQQYALHLSEQREAQYCKAYISAHTAYAEQVAALRKSLMVSSSALEKSLESVLREAEAIGQDYLCTLLKGVPKGSVFYVQAEGEVKAATEEISSLWKCVKKEPEELKAVQSTLETRSKRRRSSSPNDMTKEEEVPEVKQTAEVKKTPGKKGSVKTEKRRVSSSLKAVKERLKQDLEAKAQERISKLRNR